MESNKLFQQNYNNEGDCVQLEKYVKKIEKEFKKTGQIKIIRYYPWAVIERLFRSQGGKVEVVSWSMKVELVGKDLLPNENGELVLTTTTSNALFIHLKGTWQGQEEHEYYPIFDNQSAKIIKLPDALDLNTAKQRGMVRLIARLSGIGLEIFEQQEGQFEEDKEDNIINIKSKSKYTKPTEVETQTSNTAFEQLIKGDVVSEKKVPTPSAPKPSVMETIVSSFANDSQEFADLLLEMRKHIREKNMQVKAREFLTSKGKELLSQLDYALLQELKTLLS